MVRQLAVEYEEDIDEEHDYNEFEDEENDAGYEERGGYTLLAVHLPLTREHEIQGHTVRQAEKDDAFGGAWCTDRLH